MSLPRRAVARIRRASGGNLYYALEIGRALAGRGDRLDPSDELPIPASLQDLVRDRLAQLPAGARAAAQVAAALARPMVAVVDAALETSGGDLAAAIEAGVLERDGERLNFVHPLLATVAYQLLADSERRELHARLAWILDNPEDECARSGYADESSRHVQHANHTAARPGIPRQHEPPQRPSRPARPATQLRVAARGRGALAPHALRSGVERALGRHGE